MKTETAVSIKIHHLRKVIENARTDAWTIGGYLNKLNNPESLEAWDVNDISELVTNEFEGFTPKQAKRCMFIRTSLENLGYQTAEAKNICRIVSNTRLEALLPCMNKHIPEKEFQAWADKQPLPSLPPKKTYRLDPETMEKLEFIYQTEQWAKGEALEKLVNTYLAIQGHLTQDGKLKRKSARILKSVA